VALRYSNLTTTERAVAWALSTWARADGSGCAVGVPKLAEAARVSRATAYRVLASLEEFGWIERASGGGRGVVNGYSLAMPAWVELHLRRFLETVSPAGPFEAGNGLTSGTVSEPKPSHGGAETVSPGPRKPSHQRDHRNEDLELVTPATSPAVPAGTGDVLTQRELAAAAGALVARLRGRIDPEEAAGG